MAGFTMPEGMEAGGRAFETGEAQLRPIAEGGKP
jgi:hypothetical protein